MVSAGLPPFLNPRRQALLCWKTNEKLSPAPAGLFRALGLNENRMRRWQRCHDGKPINQAERWSIRRILVGVAEPIGRASTRGRPWLWRLREPVQQPPEN